MLVYKVRNTPFTNRHILDYHENYYSLVWSERYSELNDFEIVTEPSVANMDFFAPNSWLMIADSNRIMVVKTRTVTTDEETGEDRLTVVGVGIEQFLDDRITHIGPGAFPPTSRPGPQAVWHVNNVYGNSDFAGNTGDLVSDIKAENLAGSTGQDVRDLSFRKSLYLVVRDLLQPANLGFRMISKNPALSDIWFQVYLGTDRTRTVFFSPDLENVASMEYVDTIENHKNVAYVHFSAAAYTTVYAPGTPTSVHGFDRKVLYVDAEDLEQTEVAAARQRGLEALNAHRTERIVDGLVAHDSGYIYGQDYNLGDYVTLRGEYGYSENMRVTEYIRAVDAEGKRGYPTLSSIG